MVDPALSEFHDPISKSQTCRAVRDQDNGSPRQRPVALLNECPFTFGIEHRGGFIRRIRMGGSSSKALASAKRWRWPPDSLNSLVANNRVVALGQLRNEVMRLRSSCGRLNLRGRGVEFAKTNVVASATIEKECMLGNKADLDSSSCAG